MPGPISITVVSLIIWDVASLLFDFTSSVTSVTDLLHTLFIEVLLERDLADAL